MADESKELQAHEAHKQEVQKANGAERIRSRRAYVPRVDIYETGNDIVLLADMPGVNENSIDINLEKNVLSINGSVEPDEPDNYGLAYGEYEMGDYQRSFTLSNEIDQDKIEATVKNGVLCLRLPKAGPAQTKKIAIKAA